jgi:hypothetical protein
MDNLMRTLLTFFVTFATVTISFGQKFTVGSEIGFVSSINTDYKVTDIENRRISYYTGLNLNYISGDRLSITTGFHYLRQGYRHSTCYIFEEGVKNELIGKIDYLMIPLSVNIHVLKSRKLIATFGISGACNIKAVQDYPEPIGGCYIYYIRDLTPFIREYSINGIAGIGYKIIENEKYELISTFKYYQGLTNSFNNPYTDIQLNIERKYSSALLTVQFNYKL